MKLTKPSTKYNDTTIRRTPPSDTIIRETAALQPSISLKRKSNLGLLKQHSVLITQFFISLKSRWTELFEDPLEPPVYLYQIEIHSELGSHWNSYVYMYKYTKRSRQYSNRSKAAVQVVDMAATIHVVPPTRASHFFDHRYPCTLCISINDHAWRWQHSYSQKRLWIVPANV